MEWAAEAAPEKGRRDWPSGVGEGAGLAGERGVGAKVGVDLEEALLAETALGKVTEGTGEAEPGFAHGLGDVFAGESVEGSRGEGT